MANNRPFFRHHEPLPTPTKWGDEERQFAVKLEHTLDDIYQKFGKIRLKDLAPDVQEEFKEIIDMVDGLDKKLLNKVYPVGSIYTSVNTTSPAELFGGTWERLKSRFLLGADDTTYVNEATGGAATINLEHNHTTGDHKLVASEIPQHKHSIGVTVADSFFYIRHGAGASTASVAAGTNTTITEKSGDTWGNGFSTSSYSHKIDRVTIKHVPKVTESNVGSNGTHNHGNTGNQLSSAQSIMPPYLVVYMWKRTA